MALFHMDKSLLRKEGSKIRFFLARLNTETITI
jgi:hypothetical protein